MPTLQNPGNVLQPQGTDLLEQIEKDKELGQARTYALENFGSDPMRAAEIRQTAMRYGIQPPENKDSLEDFQKQVLLKDIDTWGQSPTTRALLANRELSRLVAGQPQDWERVGVLDTLAAAWKSGGLAGVAAAAFRSQDEASRPVERQNAADYLYGLSDEEEASGVSFNFLRDWANRTDSPVISTARQEIESRAREEENRRRIRAQYAPEVIAQAQRDLAALPQNETLRAMSEQDSLANNLWMTLLNPIDVGGYTFAQSVATTSGSYLAAAGFNAAGGVTSAVISGVLPTATAGAAAAAFAGSLAAIGALASGSFGAEYGATMLDQLQKAGINVQDPQALRDAFNNGALMDQVRRAAASRAFVVSGFDFASGLAAGVPLHPITNLLRARNLVRAGANTRAMAAGKVAENLVLQGGIQAAAGAAGEGLGNVVIGEEANLTDMYLEAIGEMVTAPLDVASARSDYVNYLVSDKVKAGQAAFANATREQAFQNMAATQLAQTAPDVAARAVHEAFKDTPLSTMVFDAEDLRPVAERLRQISPTFASQWDNASASGDAVYLPMAEAFRVRLEDDSVGGVLFRKARVTEDGMSMDEAAEYANNYDQGLQERVGKMLDASQEAIRRRQQARERADAALAPVYESLVQSGTLSEENARAFVGLQSSLLENMAGLVGEDPRSFFAKNALQVVGLSGKGKLKGFHMLGDFTGPARDQFFSISGTSQREGPVSTAEEGTTFLGRFGSSTWTSNATEIREKRGNADDGRKLFGEGGTAPDPNALELFSDEGSVRPATESTAVTTMNANGAKTEYDDNGLILRDNTKVNAARRSIAEGRSIAGTNADEVETPQPGQYAEAAPGNSIANVGGNDVSGDMVRGRSAVETMGERLEDAVSRNVRAGETADRQRENREEREASIEEVEGGRQILGNFDPDTNVIDIFKTDDPTVFLHESGHYWLSTLMRTANAILQRGSVDEAGNVLNATREEVKFLRLVRDFMAWGGEYDRETQTLKDAVQSYLSKDEDGQRAFQEKFAEAFAAYVERGKAPSERIQIIFDKCIEWLKAAFMNAHRANVEISPEVAELFDRLFVSEEYVSDAKHALGSEIIEGYRSLGLTDEDIRAIVDMDALSRASAEASLRAGMAEDARLVRDSEFMSAQRAREEESLEAEYQQLVDQKRTELNASTPFRALHFLDGTNIEYLGEDGSRQQVGGKIRADSLEGLSADVQAKLRDAGAVADDGEYTPAQVAMIFQFANVEELANAIAQARDTDVEALAKAEADEAFLDRHGVAHTNAGVKELAQQAVHNEFALRALAMHYGALTKTLGNSPRKLAATKVFVRQRLATMNLAEARTSRQGNSYWALINRRSYDALAKRAERKAWDLFGKGDFANAAVAIETAMVNAVTATEIDKIRKRADTFERRMRQLGKSKTVAGAYHVQISRILCGLGLNAKPYANEPSLQSFLQSHPDVKENFDKLSGNLQETLLSLGGDYRSDWQALSIQDFNDLDEFMKSFGHLGRIFDQTKRREAALSAGASLTRIREEIEANDKDLNRKIRPEEATQTSRLSRIKSNVCAFLSAHLRGINAMEIVDGNTQGAVTQEIGWRAQECMNEKTALNKEYYEKLSAAMAPLQRNANGGQFHIPSKPYAINRQNAFSILLYLGTEKGRNRLMRNHGFTQEDFDAIASHCTAEELQAINKIWAIFGELRGRVGELERRVNGMEPDWEIAVPYQAAASDGTVVQMTGGYVPIRYDRDQSSAKVNGVSLDDIDNQALIKGVTSHTTARSYLHDRANQVDDGLRLQLSLDGIFSGTNEVLHDLAFREFGQRIYKVLHGVDVKGEDGQVSHYAGVLQLVKERYGNEFADVIEKWFENVMTDGRQINEVKGFAAALSAVRQGVSLAGLGLNFTTALIQLTGLAPAMTRVPPQYMIQGLAAAIVHPRATKAETAARSKLMRHRTITRLREVNDMRNRVNGGQWANIRDKIYDVAYYPMLTVQGFVDHVVWNAAFNQAKTERKMSDADAVNFADRVVIDTQGDGSVVNLSQIESGGAAQKLFTTFYSFMGTVYNLNAGSLLGEKNRFKAYAQILSISVALPTLDQILRNAIQPGDDDDEWDRMDDEEKFVKGVRFVAEAGVSNLLGQFVLVREVSQALGAVAGGSQVYSYRGPTGLRAFNDLIAFAAQIQQGEFDSTFWKSFSNVAGDFGLWPSAATIRFIQGYEAWESGKTDNPSVFIFGYKDK